MDCCFCRVPNDDFLKEVSGIEDLDQCRNYLEMTDWNLESALDLFCASDSTSSGSLADGGMAANHQEPQGILRFPEMRGAAGTSSTNHVGFLDEEEKSFDSEYDGKGKLFYHCCSLLSLPPYTV